jgi:iron complex transport system substrate-binding protein
VSAFTSAKIDKILALQPDCVLGFSDMQADIAAELVRRGVQVTIFNQRSVAEIFSPCCTNSLAWWAGGRAGLHSALRPCRRSLRAIAGCVAARVAAGARRPRVFFEEWDTPHDQRHSLGV